LSQFISYSGLGTIPALKRSETMSPGTVAAMASGWAEPSAMRVGASDEALQSSPSRYTTLLPTIEGSRSVVAPIGHAFASKTSVVKLACVMKQQDHRGRKLVIYYLYYIEGVDEICLEI
jgi:hypothetical protein